MTESYICSTESSNVIARCHHDQAHCSANGHEQEALRTTPHIHHSSQGNITGGCDCIGDNVDCVQQRVRLPLTGQVRNQTVEDRALERIGEV
jgi:hypothetical protein